MMLRVTGPYKKAERKSLFTFFLLFLSANCGSDYGLFDAV
jgi:hypothetical protein